MWWGVIVDICFFRPKENIRVGIVIDAAAGKSADWMVGVKKRRSVVGMLLQGLQMTPAIVKSAASTLNLVQGMAIKKWYAAKIMFQ